MNILALEPYYGGSHRAFLDGWIAAGRHRWTLLTLPAHKWKWRMRHAAVTFAAETHDRLARNENWDLLFCSDMLNLAEFKGLAPPPVANLPAVAYFHENQLTYPVRFQNERDYQFAVTNMTTALAADAVWFNSDFHRSEFLDALCAFFKKMPDHQPTESIEQIRRKSEIHPPGVPPIEPAPKATDAPLHILWAARWEHDKNPEAFFDALRRLEKHQVDFRISVIGEQFRNSPPCFNTALAEFADRIVHWGYQPGRTEYENALTSADVFVSTANHEFFGIGAVEAMLAGAYPLLPDRLAYPEILATDRCSWSLQHLYDGTPDQLARRLSQLAARKTAGSLWPNDPACIQELVARFRWDRLAPLMDDALQKIAARIEPQ